MQGGPFGVEGINMKGVAFFRVKSGLWKSKGPRGGASLSGTLCREAGVFKFVHSGDCYLKSSIFGDQKHRSSVDDRPGRKKDLTKFKGGRGLTPLLVKMLTTFT